MKIEIIKANKDKATNCIKKYNRIAKKQNLPKCEVINEKEFVADMNFEGKTIPVTKVELTLSIDIEEVLKKHSEIPNYEILAKIEHDFGNKNMVTIYREEDKLPSLEELQTIEGKCEHCHTNRMRKTTYFVRNLETNEVKQIGKTCMAEYTMFYDVESILSMYDFLQEYEECLEEDKRYYYNCKEYYNTSIILSLIHAEIKKHGFISKSKAWENNTTSTATIVQEGLIAECRTEEVKEYKEMIDEFLSYSKEELKKIDRDYIENDTCFLFKLRKLLTYDELTIKEVPVLCCFFFTLDKLREVKQREEEKKGQNFIGNIGDKIKGIIVNVNSIKIYPNRWGVTFYINMKDKQGNLILWKASKNPFNADIEEDETLIKEVKQQQYNLSGSIKELLDNNFGKTTVVTRCKLQAV